LQQEEHHEGHEEHEGSDCQIPFFVLFVSFVVIPAPIIVVGDHDGYANCDNFMLMRTRHGFLKIAKDSLVTPLSKVR